MLSDIGLAQNLSCLLNYLAKHHSLEDDRVPPLTELSKELGISVASLREQLEVARILGFVEVKPKTGIKCLPFQFRPAVFQSLAFASSVDQENIIYFNDLRRHLETAYFIEAANLLNSSDHEKLMQLLSSAEEKINNNPPLAPYFEHKEMHLLIYSRLNNPFVSGLLEAYWDLYSASGFSQIIDHDYLVRVWIYHRKIIESITSGNFPAGYTFLLEHMDLLTVKPKTYNNQKFE